jgi:hypothetical protein
MEAGFGPCVALAFTDRHHLLSVITQGFGDVTTKLTVASDTLIEIGSISKTFTALACLQRFQAGNLDLNAPVTDYLDWFEVGSDCEEPVTINHLLSHTSGLVGMIDSVLNSRFQVWQLRNKSLGFASGEHFSYSNMGYVVLRYVLEQIIWNGGEMIGYHAILIGDMVDGIGVVVLINGKDFGIAKSDFALKVLNAVLHGKDFPEHPSPQPPRRVVKKPLATQGPLSLRKKLPAQRAG